MRKGALTLILLSALALVALTVPAAAFGQSAGDEQYVDPFQNAPEEPTGGQGGNGSQDGGPTAPAPEPAEPVQPVQEAPAITVPTPSAAAQPDGATLPSTGVPAVGMAVTGLFLMVGGAALRRAL